MKKGPVQHCNRAFFIISGNPLVQLFANRCDCVVNQRTS